MSAYYNEIDPYAAQWLRNLIGAGLIAPGDVDERSIVDVKGDDLKSYTQCHFFAGIAGWSLALRLAGWPDDRPIWTGSCPCQPFSAAGKGAAADDERHLWPKWFPLIAERRPSIVFGEQVEAAVGWGWLDAVFADLEGQGYACGAAVLPACGVGAPHIRQRLWFVADADGGDDGAKRRQRGGQQRFEPQDRGSGVATGDATIKRLEGTAGSRLQGRSNGFAGAGGVVDSESEQVGLPGRARQPGVAQGDSYGAGLSQRERDGGIQCEAAEPSERQAALSRSNAWGSADWLDCRDGKRRPVESGTFPLAHGIPARVGKLRAYGNAIIAPLAAQFIGAFLDLEAAA